MFANKCSQASAEDLTHPDEHTSGGRGEAAARGYEDAQNRPFGMEGVILLDLTIWKQ